VPIEPKLSYAANTVTYLIGSSADLRI